jgi:hypothetical protein
MYSPATAGFAGSVLGANVVAAGSTADNKLEPQLAQKRASGGFSYPQLVHRTVVMAAFTCVVQIVSGVLVANKYLSPIVSRPDCLSRANI